MNLVLFLLAFYVFAGINFALVFCFVLVGRYDPTAEKGTWGFRLLIFPGVVALWPVLARRVYKGVKTPPLEQNAHRRAAAAGAE